MIPREKDKIYIVSVTLGAITNLILNFILIPKLSSVGACIGTIAAEMAVMSYQTFSVRKELSINKYLKSIIPFFIKAIIMFICIYPINYINLNSVIRLLLQGIIGVVIYGLLNFNYIYNVMGVKEILNRILKNNKVKIKILKQETRKEVKQ